MTKNQPTTDLHRLQAVRARLEAVLSDPQTPARDLAAVSREYRQTLTAIAALAPSTGTSAVDEIAARRKKRGA